MATQKEVKSQRAAIRIHLSRMLQDVDALDKELIPISELGSIGFRPMQVGFHDDELDFSPCFFKLLPASIIDEHPLTPEEPFDLIYSESLTDNQPGDLME
ncbi:uncharacterized protein KD926_003665 [Aspergillus affinis]|uniref:uncharacterized protein n=1 Tax=Aspergillus affinis TaxID=1070780 RepID=UPI0022FE39B2|nr:uncharacterized protein KD926_003665 [Aspergillus affinis]KAI9043514.1 hypothetical protein KD926_003665 [Aspergillus affinis]